MLGFDDRELREWASKLDTAAKVMPKEATKVVSKGALNIKNAWRKAWTGHPHIRHLPRAVTYDLTKTLTATEAEIGPDKALTQGPLGHIIEYGTPGGHNAPIPGGLPALDAEAPRFEQAIADLATKELER